jgi:hypothetical protein
MALNKNMAGRRFPNDAPILGTKASDQEWQMFCADSEI